MHKTYSYTPKDYVIMQRFAEALRAYNIEYPESGKAVPKRGTAKYIEVCKRAGLEAKEPEVKIRNQPKEPKTPKTPKAPASTPVPSANAPSALGEIMLQEHIPVLPSTLEGKLAEVAKKTPKARAVRSTKKALPTGFEET